MSESDTKARFARPGRVMPLGDGAGNGRSGEASDKGTSWAGIRSGDHDGLARALGAHKAAFAMALEHQHEEFMRIAEDRLQESRRIAAAIDACATWEQLVDVQERWAQAKRRACLAEAKWLVMYADLIGHPDWLTRQVDAAKRANRHRDRTATHESGHRDHPRRDTFGRHDPIARPLATVPGDEPR